MLQKDRNTPMRDGQLISLPVAAMVKIYAGALVALDSRGNATPGKTAPDLLGIGRAEYQVDNSIGLSGDNNVTVRKGVFRFNNSTGRDEITLADVGSNCYIVDDSTVASTYGAGTRSVAGIVFDVDSDGVWVKFN